MFDWILCPFMRAFDRYKIATSIPKRSLTPQPLSATDFSEYANPGMLDDPEVFYKPAARIDDVRTHRVEPLPDGCKRRYVSYTTNWPVGAEENLRGYAVITEPPQDAEVIAGMFGRSSSSCPFTCCARRGDRTAASIFSAATPFGRRNVFARRSPKHVDFCTCSRTRR